MIGTATVCADQADMIYLYSCRLPRALSNPVRHRCAAGRVVRHGLMTSRIRGFRSFGVILRLPV